MKKRMIFFFLGLVCLMGRVEIVVGQKVASHPESPADEGGGAPVVVYGTVMANQKPDPLELSVFRDYAFNSRRGPGVHTVSLEYEQGNMIEGRLPNEMTFEFHLPHLEDLAYMSLAFGNDHAFLDRFVILPGDTIELYVDLRYGAIHFGGNAVERMELQHSLALLDRKKQLFSQPYLFTGNPESVLSNPQFGEKYKELEKAGRRRMKFIQPGEEEIARLLQSDAAEGLTPSREQQDMLSEAQLEAGLQQLLYDNLMAKKTAAFLGSLVAVLHRASRGGDRDQLEKLRETINNKLPERLEGIMNKDWHPDAYGPVDLYTEWARLYGRLEDVERFEAIKEIPLTKIRDRAALDYFYHQYEFVLTAQEQLEDYLGMVSDPFSRTYLENLLALRREGGELRHFDFVDDSGRPFDEDMLRGKVTLLDFYIYGCGASRGFFHKAVKPLIAQFGDRDDFQVITISADPSDEIWKQSLKTGDYTSESTINLHTRELSHSHPFLVNYGIYGFPSKMIIGKDGTILQSAGLPGNFEVLKEIIEQALSE
ncbi:thioredoxin family protein [Litoribacter alkaliphilus]|uniref:Thioredoxin family protein n=1 Tax=Litoribacter ruber TaxID=702568 RepID=A0AAP2CQB3_9BACT|nr:hypothetical protein [Litoribacter alkaliphilus]MBS9525972.1 thioredoxin family protein [Litoribacter alkaliphilus]